MANPTTEGNSLLDPKGSRKLLKAVPLWAIAQHGKAGQIVSQEGSSRAQRKITSLAGDQPSDEDQLKLGAGSGLRESSKHTRASDRQAPGQKIACRDTRQTLHTFGTKRL